MRREEWQKYVGKAAEGKFLGTRARDVLIVKWRGKVRGSTCLVATGTLRSRLCLMTLLVQCLNKHQAKYFLRLEAVSQSRLAPVPSSNPLQLLDQSLAKLLEQGLLIEMITTR